MNACDLLLRSLRSLKSSVKSDCKMQTITKRSQQTFQSLHQSVLETHSIVVSLSELKLVIIYSNLASVSFPNKHASIFDMGLLLQYQMDGPVLFTVHDFYFCAFVHLVSDSAAHYHLIIFVIKSEIFIFLAFHQFLKKGYLIYSLNPSYFHLKFIICFRTVNYL